MNVVGIIIKRGRRGGGEGEGNRKSDTGSGGLEEGKKEDGVKTVTGNGERRGALREVGVCCMHVCTRYTSRVSN